MKPEYQKPSPSLWPAAAVLILALPFLAGLLDRAKIKYFSLSGRLLLSPMAYTNPKSYSAGAAVFLKTGKATLEQSRFLAAWAAMPYVYLLAPIQTYMAIRILAYSRRLSFRRKMHLTELLRIYASMNPCLVPILKTRDAKKINFDADFALAESPISLALKSQAYLDGRGNPVKYDTILNPRTGLPVEKLVRPPQARLDEAAIRQVFANQLGPQVPDIKNQLVSFWRDLAAALWMHLRQQQKTAFKILNELSLNWNPLTKNTSSPLALKVWKDLNPADLPDKVLIHMLYRNVFFMALLKAARRSGVLPTSLFIWLKPADRTLFYALNQVGLRTAWAEAAGPWSHFVAERRAGRPLNGASVSLAIEGLWTGLEQEGWLKVPEAAPQTGPSQSGQPNTQSAESAESGSRSPPPAANGPAVF
ncbi:MAG: hypothetical protein LBK52_01325 [Deltaproteobacteria bacterium]|jgi:hypothetical protein|nr:hypothetical protein [Deltaproteobacteria bacterium]